MSYDEEIHEAWTTLFLGLLIFMVITSVHEKLSNASLAKREGSFLSFDDHSPADPYGGHVENRALHLLAIDRCMINDIFWMQQIEA